MSIIRFQGGCAEISEGEEPKEGEVDLERGGTDPLANYDQILATLRLFFCISMTIMLFLSHCRLHNLAHPKNVFR